MGSIIPPNPFLRPIAPPLALPRPEGLLNVTPSVTTLKKEMASLQSIATGYQRDLTAANNALIRVKKLSGSGGGFNYFYDSGGGSDHWISPDSIGHNYFAATVYKNLFVYKDNSLYGVLVGLVPYNDEVAGWNAVIAYVKNEIANNNSSLALLKSDLAAATAREKGSVPYKPVKVPPAPKQKSITLDPKQLIYNVPPVTQVYFNQSASFKEEMQLTSNNRPEIVTSALNLWKDSGGHKGMIVIWVPPKTSSINNDILSVAFSDKPQRYGFQFHYNPGSLQMSYSGSNPVDPNLQATGQEQFNVVGAAVTQSTIQFQLPLNRMFDSHYYDPKTHHLKAGVPSNLYGGRTPSLTDQEAIFSKGTMYDVEFLLNTLVGYRGTTSLRGLTSDLGWVTGRSVELHLGNSLRYLGYINSFNLNHTFFNERMVPIFSTIDISFNRIPDYAGFTGATEQTAK